MSLFSPRKTLILLRGDGTRPVEIVTSKPLSFVRADGANDSRSIDLDSKDCADMLFGPGEGYSIKVKLDKPQWPGSYTFTVGVGGKVRGWSQQTLTISSGLYISKLFLSGVGARLALAALTSK